MKKIAEVPNVRHFDVGSSLYAVSADHKSVFRHNLDDHRPECLYAGEDNLMEIYANDSVAWVNTSYGKGILFQYEKAIKKDHHLIFVDQDPVAFLVSENTKSSWMNGKEEVLWSFDHHPFFFLVTQDLFLDGRREEQDIVCRNKHTGVVQWICIIPVEFRSYAYKDFLNKKTKVVVNYIESFLGIHKNVLWVTLSNGVVLGLDLSSGQILHSLTYPVHLPEGFIRVHEGICNNYGRYMNLDKIGGKLFGLWGRYYFEADVANPRDSYTYYDIEEELNRNDFIEVNITRSRYGNAWKGSHIFIGERDTKGNALGVFDRNQRRVVWAAKMPESKTIFANIRLVEYAKGRVYAQDGNSILHVYEPEL